MRLTSGYLQELQSMTVPGMNADHPDYEKLAKMADDFISYDVASCPSSLTNSDGDEIDIDDVVVEMMTGKVCIDQHLHIQEVVRLMNIDYDLASEAYSLLIRWYAAHLIDDLYEDGLPA